MEWWDDSDAHLGIHAFVFNGRINGDHRLVVWKSVRDLGYGTSICIQIWYGGSRRWGEVVKTPEGTTVDEAKALAITLYRMGG